VTGQRAGRAIAQPRGHPLLGEDVIADAAHDPDKAEANGRRSEIDDRHQVRRQTTSADVSFSRGIATEGRTVVTLRS
jgi:hypothetical protein